MANVLLISYDYPPILSPESIQVQRRAIMMANLGHNVFVLTSHLNPYFEFLDNTLLMTHPKIKIFRTKKPLVEKLLHIFFKYFNIGDRKLWWKEFAYTIALRIIKDYKIDLLYTDSVPFVNHFVGLKLKAQMPELKWIAHFSDPWSLNPYLKYRFKWQYKLNKKFETKILKLCDIVCVVSNKMKELFLNEYGFLENKIKVVPHVYDEKLYKTNKKQPQNQKIKVVHTGNIYGLRSIRYLLEALKEIRHQNIEFHFYGKIKKEEKSLVEKWNLNAFVKIFLQVTYLESLKIMTNADFLLVVDAPIKNSPFFPSKLVDYIGAKKPIIALTPNNSTTAEVLRELNMSQFIASPDDKEDIKKLLCKIIEGISFKVNDKIKKYYMNNVSFIRDIIHI